MAMIELHSWRCPVDENRLGTLILTEQRLFYSLKATPAKLETLTETATDSMIEAALPRNSYSIPIPEIQALRRVQDRPRFQIIGANSRKIIAFGDEEAAAGMFVALVRELGLESIQEVEASKLETLRNPILCLIFVLIGGVFLGILAGQEHYTAGGTLIFRIPYDFAHWAGPAPIWVGTAVGIITSSSWLGIRLKSPARAFLAARGGQERSRSSQVLGEDALRTATANLLGIDATRLTPEIRFHEDLRIPPGVLLDVLAELEGSLELDLSKVTIRTFGDLLALIS